MKLKLSYLIPEFLPIRGKRARVYYHGIAPFCIVCNSPGHVKAECENDPVPWNEYVESLKDTGIPPALFEPLDNSFQFTPNNSNFASSTPRREGDIRVELFNIIQEAFGNSVAAQNQSQNNSVQNPNPNLNQSINPTPVRRSARHTPGDIDPRPVTPPTRGNNSSNRGRGRGVFQFVNPNQNQFQIPRGRGQQLRGRGRGRPGYDFYVGDDAFNRRGRYLYKRGR